MTLLDKAPQAEIRIGDYPRRRQEVSLTIVASELVGISRVERIYEEATKTLQTQVVTKTETKNLINELKGKAEGIPILA